MPTLKRSTLSVAFLLFASGILAEPLQDGADAFRAGDFTRARALWLPLALAEVVGWAERSEAQRGYRSRHVGHRFAQPNLRPRTGLRAAGREAAVLAGACAGGPFGLPLDPNEAERGRQRAATETR